MTATRVRDMPWEELLVLLRQIGPEMAKLGARGDQFALKVEARYRYAHQHPTDPKANRELRVAIEDYVNRDLRLSELYELGSKFGHRLDEPEKEAGPRIFMPESISKQ